MRAAYVVAGVALALAGCEKAQADRVERSVVTVDDRGARPQYLLRYAIPQGFTQDVDSVIDVDMQVSGAQQQSMVMPRMIVGQTITVDKVDARGGMHLQVETGTVRSIDDATIDDALGRAAGDAAKAIQGMRLSATVSPDGSTHGMHVDASSIPAVAREQVQQVEQAIDTMVTRLPDVSIGVGARWTVEQTVRLSNMRVFYTFRYEVLEISEGAATLHADVEMSAPPQPMITPTGTAHLDGMVGRGSVDMVLDLHRLVDHVTSDMTMDMTMAVAGQVLDFDLRTQVQVQPTGEAPAPRSP